MARPDPDELPLPDENVEMLDPGRGDRAMDEVRAIAALHGISMAEPEPTYAVDWSESKVAWPLAEAAGRADAASAELDVAHRWSRFHLFVVVGTVLLDAVERFLVASVNLDVWLLFASLLLVVARVGVISRLSATALACAASTKGIPQRGFQVALAVFIPFYNFVMPFRIMRRLADASGTEDLPRLHVMKALPGTTTYRSAEKRMLVDASPVAPSSPLLVVWQALFVGSFFLGFGYLSFAVAIACFAAEVFVFRRVRARFRSRVDHLRALGLAQKPPT